jgi:hypothetical protein
MSAIAGSWVGLLGYQSAASENARCGKAERVVVER